jgi:hypothetical protein
MHSNEDLHTAAHANPPYTWLAGATLIAIGILLFADQYLKTGWLPVVAAPVVGMFLLYRGIMDRKMGPVIPGILFTSLGLGGLLTISLFFNLPLAGKVGLLLAAFALGWYAITGVGLVLSRRVIWWPLIPGGVLGGLAVSLLASPLRITDFVLYPLLGLGLAFLAWGLGARLIGLIIPGALLASIGPGMALAWGDALANRDRLPVSASLTQTGVMLVCFALGWALITVFSRFVTHKFIWWPLIPAGILAMTGWGLYIGGNPRNALNFISNTGSLGLILLGVYLLIWRSALHK